MNIYIDLVRFTDQPETEEVRDYLKTEHTENWLVWIWSDTTLRIPAHRVKDVTTYEGDAGD